MGAVPVVSTHQPMPGFVSGCCKSSSDCGQCRSCSYLWVSNGGCEKKKKRKSPSGGFHQQFMAMTTMPVLPPLLILVHPLNSTHRLCSQVFPSTASLNKTLQ